MTFEKWFILWQIQNLINEYRITKWFEEKQCKYIEQLDNVIRIDYENTQAHVGFKADMMHVIIRGSDEPKDWFGQKGNFNFKYITQKVKTDIKVSAGFCSVWEDIREKVFEIIDKTGTKEVVFVGHSRGSAGAAIAAENTAFHYPNVKVGGIYFSSPMPGNDAFRKQHDKLVKAIHLWVTGDPIVLMPPWICGYRSVGQSWSTYGGLYDWPFIGAHYPTCLQDTIRLKYQ